MKYVWEDLPERKNCFTVRNASMINLNTGKIVRQYVANTRINVVQKCNMSGKTYYRTSEAAHHYLNYAFEASAFGLPNELAPSAPSTEDFSPNSNIESASRTHHSRLQEKQKSIQKVVPSNGGGRGRLRALARRIFRRKNG
jgi:hypothetical protein